MTDYPESNNGGPPRHDREPVINSAEQALAVVAGLTDAPPEPAGRGYYRALAGESPIRVYLAVTDAVPSGEPDQHLRTVDAFFPGNGPDLLGFQVVQRADGECWGMVTTRSPRKRDSVWRMLQRRMQGPEFRRAVTANPKEADQLRLRVDWHRPFVWHRMATSAALDALHAATADLGEELDATRLHWPRAVEDRSSAGA